MIGALQTYINDPDEILLIDKLAGDGVFTEAEAETFMQAMEAIRKL